MAVRLAQLRRQEKGGRLEEAPQRVYIMKHHHEERDMAKYKRGVESSRGEFGEGSSFRTGGTRETNERGKVQKQRERRKEGVLYRNHTNPRQTQPTPQTIPPTPQPNPPPNPPPPPPSPPPPKHPPKCRQSAISRFFSSSSAAVRLKEKRLSCGREVLPRLITGPTQGESLFLKPQY